MDDGQATRQTLTTDRPMTPLGRSVRLTAAVALAATTALTAAAQQPTFRTSTEVVQLDVSVLDKQGQPVHGLSRQDFVVLENGKPHATSRRTRSTITASSSS